MTTPSSIEPRNRNDNDPNNDMNTDINMDEPCPRMVECKNSIREMMEKVEDLSENGSIPSGTYVTLANSIKAIFDNLDELEGYSIEHGAQGVVLQALIDNPIAAQLANHQIKLQSVSFIVSLVTIKVETIRIKRRELDKGPFLTTTDVFVLEHWADELVGNALLSWRWHFGYNLTYGVYGEDRPDKQVPSRFKSMIFALIRMQLDALPIILRQLKAWGVAPSNIFPECSWRDEELVDAISCEPRMVPFIIGHRNLDMNYLAHMGPRLRSRDNMIKRANLNFNQLRLMNGGIAVIQDSFKGHIHKQKVEPWRAWNFTWPRAELPLVEELLGDYF